MNDDMVIIIYPQISMYGFGYEKVSHDSKFATHISGHLANKVIYHNVES
jgi:hypothetical protein